MIEFQNFKCNGIFDFGEFLIKQTCQMHSDNNWSPLKYSLKATRGSITADLGFQPNCDLHDPALNSTFKAFLNKRLICIWNLFLGIRFLYDARELFSTHMSQLLSKTVITAHSLSSLAFCLKAWNHKCRQENFCFIYELPAYVLCRFSLWG